MNPLIHAEIGWLLAQSLPRRRDRILVTAMGVLPDLDGVRIAATAVSGAAPACPVHPRGPARDR